MSSSRKVKRILNIPNGYFDVLPVGEQLFPVLYQFENGLRLAIDKHMSMCYTTDWWERKLKFDLPVVYNYAEEKRKKRDLMPWIGDSARVPLLPIHHVTLGHLEEIVKMYQADCVPDLFPTLNFFLGHMDFIKMVRNLYSHMFPCLTTSDARLARSEITTLCVNLKKKL